MPVRSSARLDRAFARRWRDKPAKGAVHRRRVAEHLGHIGLELHEVGALGETPGILSPNSPREVAYSGRRFRPRGLAFAFFIVVSLPGVACLAPIKRTTSARSL
jgi:hypothetical protein